MNILAIVLLSLTSQPALGEAVVEQVDLIEVNAFYDETGRPVFDQIIFYDWDWDAGRYQVLAWRLIKKADQYPQRNWGGGGYVAIWFDGDTLRKVKSYAVSHTFTQTDPELTARDSLPKEQRRELKSGPVRPDPFGNPMRQGPRHPTNAPN